MKLFNRGFIVFFTGAVSIYDVSSKYSAIEIERDGKPNLIIRVEKEVWSDEQKLTETLKKINLLFESEKEVEKRH
jgi:hypothetical protein